MLTRIAKLTLLLLVFSLGYIQPFVVVFNFQVPPTEFIFLFAAAFWLFALFAKQTVFRFHEFFWLLLLYLAAMLISAIFSGDQRTSFIKLAGEIYLLSLPVLIYNLVEDFDELKRLIRVWLIAAALVSLFGIVVFGLFYLNREHALIVHTVGAFGAVPVGNFPRLRLVFLTPSQLCNYLIVGFALLLIAFELKWIGKIAFFIFAAALLFTAIFTVSSGLGGFALIGGLWIYYRHRKDKKLSARLSLIGGIAVASAFLILNCIALQPHSTAHFAFDLLGYRFQPSPRILIWQASMRTFFENFLVGRGVGRAACEVVFENTDGSFAVLTDAHNVFLSVAAQEGVFGLAAVLSIIFYLIKKNFGALYSDEKTAVVAAGLLIAFVSAFVYQGLVGSFEDSRHLWVLIGLILCAESLAKKKLSADGHR